MSEGKQETLEETVANAPDGHSILMSVREARQILATNKELQEVLRHAEIGLANAKSYRSLPEPEQQSVISALDAVRAALSKAEGKS